MHERNATVLLKQPAYAEQRCDVAGCLRHSSNINTSCSLPTERREPCMLWAKYIIKVFTEYFSKEIKTTSVIVVKIYTALERHQVRTVFMSGYSIRDVMLECKIQ